MILILIAAAIISGVLGITINIRPPNDDNLHAFFLKIFKTQPLTLYEVLF
jgi:hypothetical protein